MKHKVTIDELNEGDTFYAAWGEYVKGKPQTNSPATGIICKEVNGIREHCFMGHQLVEPLNIKKPVKEYSGFELKGYEVDYFMDGKFLGSVVLQEADREDFGYTGRRYHTADETFEVKKGRKITKIKKGSKYYTELQVICGRRIEDC